MTAPAFYLVPIPILLFYGRETPVFYKPDHAFYLAAGAGLNASIFTFKPLSTFSLYSLSSFNFSLTGDLFCTVTTVSPAFRPVNVNTTS